ncbi:zinc-dependent alcohol dehydrogenase family protein [Niallia endozanthoxylica]|uniref:Zinc-dependent alcohol dehydrogenase family protein n=1 Tax=Niallia endozanthoxylica TaxID=2036016 RepID=A0A5J5HPZ6_9BACI|nr:zinc-dependent alcohol dehydrogenase family protein [Niallia endozanthoxylica]KAA9023852.1 zinc-dependent alcohol dehydrogenase family protein [Niallia endozanthoxylica]
MKAQVIHSFGEAAVFQLADVPVPKVKPMHVLIKVKATSLNPIDTKIRSGVFAKFAPEFPAVLHGDVAGMVTEVGEGVTDFKVGDEVYGFAGGVKGTGGALAEYMLADARLLAHKPKNLSFAEAAAMPVISITAWEALIKRANIQSGEEILIHGGTGGVGHMAIQLAKWAGAKVFTTVSTPEKAQIAQELGADVVINYKETPVRDYVNKYTDGKGFKYIFDTVDRENLERSIEAASLYGTIVAIAVSQNYNLAPFLLKSLNFQVVFIEIPILHEEFRYINGEILKKVTPIIEEGKLKPLIDQRLFTFDEIAEAHDYYEAKKAVGKIVLVNNW